MQGNQGNSVSSEEIRRLTARMDGQNVCSFAGIATPTTNPGAPDGNVFYLASESGTYSNFNAIEIAAGEAAILEWRGSWMKKNAGFATQHGFSKLYDKIISEYNKIFVNSGDYNRFNSDTDRKSTRLNSSHSV